MAHYADSPRSDFVIHQIKRRREHVRFWFSAYGTLVGCWRGRNGKTYAVGHDKTGRVAMYRAVAPSDNWGIETVYGNSFANELA